MNMRIGHGYDVHKLVSGRRLILGGVDIPHELGLLGHSDADVLLHAVMDSILGALGMGDIGRHFPDTDKEFEGISSMHLLTRVKKILDECSGRIINLDATLILQKPKVAPYIEKMRENIAFCLGCDKSCINVKATTEEKLGFTGREEGISAHAVVLLATDKKGEYR
jgi:2-C-methyl-D-erythritol 2,4-cyclodiphosphate synthase